VFDKEIASTCSARHVCRQHEIMCAVHCPLYIDLRYQFALSGIPDEYRGLTVETLPDNREHLNSFRHFAQVASTRKPNNGLFLVSAMTGNGKTEAACAIAGSYIVSRTMQAIRDRTSLPQLVQFVNVTELLDLIRSGMSDEDANRRSTTILQRIERADVVILDDLGAERPTEYVQERLYALINGIWSNRKRQTLIATSNKSLQAIEITLGPRVRSRVDGLTVAIEYKGKDQRRK